MGIPKQGSQVFPDNIGLQDHERSYVAILSFGSLLIIVDPVTTIPAFLAMTEKNTPQERIRMAKLASTVAFLVLLAFFLGGQQVLEVFGITLPAFEIAAVGSSFLLSRRNRRRA